MRVLIERLSKTYQDRSGQSVEALQSIDLSVEEEEFLAIVGRSGCGKSTLLNIIAGLLTPSDGGVFFEGLRDGSHPPTVMVFQEFALFPWRTVLGNIEFALEERGVAAGERHERAMRLVELVGLAGFEEKYPHQLSGGMRQRVGIARALAVDPAVLLMDEPFSALDAQTRQLLQIELLSIWERTRKAILYVTLPQCLHGGEREAPGPGDGARRHRYVPRSGGGAEGGSHGCGDGRPALGTVEAQGAREVGAQALRAGVSQLSPLSGWPFFWPRPPRGRLQPET